MATPPQPPLDKCFVCCSALEKGEKQRVREETEALGAIFEQALTIRTTHLICKTPTTDKYRVALQHGCHIVSCEWVWECSKTQTRASEEKFLVKLLQKCVICPTGLPTEVRNEIKTLVESNGGTYVADLTKHATHLIAVEAKGSKFLYAEKWNIKIVTLDWLKDSCTKGVKLDESSYPIPIPLQINPQGQSLAPSELQFLEYNNNNDFQNQKQKTSSRISNASSTSSLNIEKECLDGCICTVLGFGMNDFDCISKDLIDLGAKVTEINSREITHVIIASKENLKEVINKISIPGVRLVTRDWINACKKNHQRIPETDFSLPLISSSTTATTTTTNESTTTQTTVKKEIQQQVQIKAQNQISSCINENEDSKKKLLQGSVFTSVGFTNEQDIRNSNFVRWHSGSFMLFGIAQQPQNKPMIDFIIAPHGYKEVSELLSDFPAATLVSPQWLEMCNKFNQILRVEESSFFSPLPFPLPIITMSKVVASTTGLSEQQKIIIGLLLKDMGAKMTSDFSKRTNTHLICNCPSSDNNKLFEGEKFKKAQLWGIPVVKVEWVHRCAMAGKIQPWNDLIVSNSTLTTSINLTTPLKGIIACISNKTFTMERMQQIIDDIAKLGGEGLWDFSTRITHYITEGNERTQLYRRATQLGAKIVSPLWIDKCLETQSHVNESDFPPSINPTCVLNFSASRKVDQQQPVQSVQQQSNSNLNGFGGFSFQSTALLSYNRNSASSFGRNNVVSGKRKQRGSAKFEPPITGTECLSFFDRYDRISTTGIQIETTNNHHNQNHHHHNTNMNTTTTKQRSISAPPNETVLLKSNEKQQHEQISITQQPQPTLSSTIDRMEVNTNSTSTTTTNNPIIDPQQQQMTNLKLQELHFLLDKIPEALANVNSTPPAKRQRRISMKRSKGATNINTSNMMMDEDSKDDSEKTNGTTTTTTNTTLPSDDVRSDAGNSQAVVTYTDEKEQQTRLGLRKKLMQASVTQKPPQK